MRIIILSCCVLAACLQIAWRKRPAILFYDSFEKKVQFSNWKHKEATASRSITYSDSVARTGKYSARFDLYCSDTMVANGKRAELVINAESSMHIERWYRFSIYLPPGYAADSLTECLAQWHETPDFQYGETWRSPPLALLVKGNRWVFQVLWATQKVNTNATISGQKKIDLGAIETGVWTDWIIHLKLDYTSKGIVEIWRNGKQVADYRGPNYYNDEKGPFFKIGIYKWEWNKGKPWHGIDHRVVYFDDVIIGNESASFKMIAVKAAGLMQ